MKKIFIIILLTLNLFGTPNFEKIFEKQNIVMLLIDPKDGSIVDANPKALEFYGYSKQEITSKTIQQINTLTPEQVKEEINLAQSQNRDYFIFKHLLKNGEEKRVEVRSIPYDFAGKQLLFSIIQDLSEFRIEKDGLFHYQKRLEEEISKKTKEIEIAYEKERKFILVIFTLLAIFIGVLIFLLMKLKKAKKEIEHEKNFQHTLIDSMYNILIATNKDGIITRFNKTAEEILGYKEEELIFKNTPFEILHDKKETIQRAKEFSEELGQKIEVGFDVFTIKTDLGLENTHEWTYFKKDGTKIDIELTVTPIKNSDGEIEGYIGIASDISERKRVQQALEDAKSKAEDASKIKSEFLANMSHEIRTPMNAIIGLGSILDDLVSEPKQKEILQKINSSSNILLGIINDILDYSKIEAGKLELEHKNFEAETLLSQLKVMFEYKACEKGIELYFHIKNDVPIVLISDELRLMQILSNLISNAIKFTHKGQVTLSIELLSKNDYTNKAKIRFSVEDSGIGINEKQLLKIFNPFTQADSSTTREYGGSGLGLVISQNIIKALGGEIKVASNFGKGSIFSFDLELGFAACNLKHTIVSKECHKVLIVDDQEIARLVLRDMLENFGCQCTEASNGVEALEIIEKANKENQEFDILLIDWNMPILNGIDTLKKLQNMEYKKAPTVFMISAHAKDSIDLNSVQIDSFISKPITPSSLFDALVKAKKGYTISQIRNIKTIPYLNGLSILVVEDNEINQEVAVMLLQKVGILVDIASNGKEGYEKFKTNQTKYNLILMDLQMPIMSGYEATRRIREINKTIPIIALTAAAMIEDKQKALEAGMNDHLGKPINQNALYKTISKFTKRNINNILELEFLQNTISSKELINSLLIKFKKQLTSGEFKDIVEIVKTEPKEASKLIHTLKGVSGNLGANELFDITKVIDYKYKTNEQITQNDIDLLELSIKNILIKLNEIKDETATVLPLTQKIKGDELQKLLTLVKQSLINADLIDSDLKLKLISNLHGIVENDELEEFKNYIDEFEFDKALRIIKGWKI